jgi:predicted phage tail protein
MKQLAIADDVLEGEVIGRGGGKDGGEARTPIEEDNNLRAKSKAFIDFVVGEGQIGGLVDGGKSIIVDGTRVQDDQGGWNFTGVSFIERTGLPTQDYIPGFNASAIEAGVGVELLAGVATVRTITNLDVDAVELKFRLNALVEVIGSGATAGDRKRTQVKHKIEVQPDGDAYVEHASPVIYGKTTSVYEKSYHVDLPGSGPWNIRITRITPDSESSLLSNASFWWGYTELIEARFEWPGIAHYGLIFDAEQFGGNFKKVEFEVYGRLIQVPSNYDPVTRIYTGIWDGTFVSAFTNNPAWIIYDILTNNVYGLGIYIDAALTNKWSLYTIGVYCDGLVPDGVGGTEPRLVFDGVFRDAQNAYEALTEMMSVIRGLNYWAGGTVNFSQDAPGDAIMVISPSDVVDGIFDYSNTGLKSRHSIVHVGYQDRIRNIGRIEIVSDVELIIRHGLRPLRANFRGCTSRGQAHRYGKWILESEKIENSLVAFSGGYKLAALMPGELVDIADDVIQGIRFGGRVVSVVGTTVTLDAPVTLDVAESYVLTTTKGDNTLETANITSTGTSEILTVDASLTAVPGSSWVITGTDISPRRFRILTNKQKNAHTFEVVALFHDPTKFDRIEAGVDLSEPVYSSYKTGPISAPLNLGVEEYLYRQGLIIRSAVTVSWTPPDDHRVTGFVLDVLYPDGTTFESVYSGSEPSFELRNTVDGAHKFRVTSLSLGSLSGSVSKIFTLSALRSPPDDVTNFRAQIVEKIIVLSWSPVADLDLSHYQIRQTSNLLTPTWDSALIVEDFIQTTSLSLPAMAGTYLIKAVDTSNVQSLNATLIATSVTKEILALNVVELVENGATWPGVKTDTRYQSVLGALILDGADDVYDWADIHAIDNIYYGLLGLAPLGYYEFEEIVDLAAIYTSRISADVVIGGGDLFSDFYQTVDLFAVTNIYGSDASDWGFELQLATSDDAVIYSAWEAFTIGDYTARAIKFRIKLTSAVSFVTPLVTSVIISVDMPDRLESGEDLVCPVNGEVRAYGSSFRVNPALAVTGQDMATGDYFVLTLQGVAGFDVEFFNSSDVSISRTYDFIAKGYGYVTS